MISTDNLIVNMIDNPVRNIKARVELYNGSTLLNTFNYNDKLKSFTIERVGAGKFFGFGVCQKLNIKLIDVERELDITTANSFKVAFGVAENYIYPLPLFFVTEVNRDETTNELSITAYDALNAAHSHFFNELDILIPYDIKTIVGVISALLGLQAKVSGSIFDLMYENGANFEGTENLREVLDKIAEATQTIYYINSQGQLVFKKLVDSINAFDINKNKYFELDSRTNRRLGAITHATELGDNVTAAIDASGTTQIIRDNPFLDLREDTAEILNNAITAIGGLTINQFSCSWRGNFLLEIGDKLALTTKDNNIVYSYLLDDVIEYNGALKQHTQWSFEDTEETESNPSNLGDALKQTFARVDKINKEIELVASTTEENASNISRLLIDTEAITANVKEVEHNIEDKFNTTDAEIEEISNQVALAITAEQMQLAISTELINGVDKVTTSTGFTFNDDGLRVSKSDSEISTQITENGMTVSKNDEAVLIANNEGVQAEDLHATTYLIIGNNSRFEDYTDISGNARTGCFWIG